jgi:glutamyl endopeptidase
MALPANSERPAGLDPAFEGYSPPRVGPEAAPVPLLDAWYATYPDPDVEGIFQVGVTELVFGLDERMRVSDTTIEPFKWVTMLEITAADGSQWRGTGWLASRSMVVTAGHCVYMANRGGWASSIRVRFGAMGDDAGNLVAEAAAPVTATEFRSVAGWARNQDPEADYGAILLSRPMPAGYGNFSYEARSDAQLTSQLFNVDGYPADKRPYSQWYYARYSAGVTPRTLTYTADTYGGQSGAAIYAYDGTRVALGIHTRGDLFNNQGVRITQSVASNLTRWTNEAARGAAQESAAEERPVGKPKASKSSPQGNKRSRKSRSTSPGQQ